MFPSPSPSSLMGVRHLQRHYTRASTIVLSSSSSTSRTNNRIFYKNRSSNLGSRTQTLTTQKRVYSSLRNAPPVSMNYFGVWNFLETGPKQWPRLTIHDLPDVDYTKEDILELQEYISKLKIERRKDHAHVTAEDESDTSSTTGAGAAPQQQQQQQGQKGISADWVNTMFGQFIRHDTKDEINEEYIVFDDGKSVDGVYSGFDNYMRTMREQEQMMTNDTHTPWFFGTDFFRAMSTLEKETARAHQSKLPWQHDQIPSVISARKMGITFETMINKYKSEMLVHYLDVVERKKYMDPDRSAVHTVMLKVLCDEHAAATSQKEGEAMDNGEIERQVQEARLALEILDAEEELLIATARRFLDKFNRAIQKRQKEEHSHMRGSPRGRALFRLYGMRWMREQIPKLNNPGILGRFHDNIVYDKNRTPLDRVFSESNLFSLLNTLLERDPESVLATPLSGEDFISFEEIEKNVEEFFKDLAEQKKQAMQELDNLFKLYETTLRNHGWIKQQPTEYKETLEVMLGRAANLMRNAGCTIVDKDTVERTYNICKQSKLLDEATMLNLYKVCRDSARMYALTERRARPMHYPDRAFYGSDFTLSSNMVEPVNPRARISFYRSQCATGRGHGRKK